MRPLLYRVHGYDQAHWGIEEDTQSSVFYSFPCSPCLAPRYCVAGVPHRFCHAALARLWSVFLRYRLAEGAVAQHGIQRVEAASGEGDE